MATSTHTKTENTHPICNGCWVEREGEWVDTDEDGVQELVQRPESPERTTTEGQCCTCTAPSGGPVTLFIDPRPTCTREHDA